MTDTQSITLPPPKADQPFIIISALEAGVLDFPTHIFVKDVPKDEVHTVPSLSFSLRHSQSNAHLLFDLGLRKDVENFTPSTQELIKETMPVQIPQDVSESLIKGGIQPKDVTTIVLSHLHFDHVGDHKLFPNATFITGEGSRAVLAEGYPSEPSSEQLADSVPVDRTRFLSADDFTSAIAGFPHTYDYFGDGSLYIIDSPGHMRGHLNLLVRTSAAGTWLYLGGDTCHDPRLLKDIHRTTEEAHDDLTVAKAHLGRVSALRGLKGVQVLVAHDWEWYENNRGSDAFLPGKISPINV
ncbi:beta-lactamase-like protein [Hysterangium stoloniferum]|nr:beta-lactamase-like protein [Hysterangium stoloniferum]